MVNNVNNDIRARVFISCGQQKNTDEVQLAIDIKKKLEDMGFEPYIAVEEQTLKGIKENIFQRLSESEYCIFIDFKRERLFKQKNTHFEDTGKYRGSLFSHQELAIATFSSIEVLSFREKDVKDDDGILKFIQANCIEFTDKHLIPDFIGERVRVRKWNSNWRNELRLERENSDYDDSFDVKINKKGRYYHIKIWNLHWKELAIHCTAYLEKIRDISTNEIKTIELVEFKWKGITTPTVAIPPKSFRYLDAFHIYYESPSLVYLGINPFLVDYGGYHELYKLEGPATFELTFVVFSEAFSPARATFKLIIGNQINDIEFSMI